MKDIFCSSLFDELNYTHFLKWYSNPSTEFFFFTRFLRKAEDPAQGRRAGWAWKSEESRRPLFRSPASYCLYGLLEQLHGDPDGKADGENGGTDGCYICND
jgi:hypothetical protein